MGRCRILLTAIAVALLAPGVALEAYPLQLSLGSVGNAQVAFSGTADAFTFQNSTLPGSAGYGFQMQNQSGFADNSPSLSGLRGSLSGVFKIGGITSSGRTQSAPVSGTGTFSVFDGSNVLTASANWLNLVARGPNPSSGGPPITFGTVNLSNFSYSGNNAALLEMKSGGSALLTVTLQFPQGRDLTQLTKQLSNQARYTAELSVVPEPSFYWPVIVGLGGLTAVWHFRRKRQRTFLTSAKLLKPVPLPAKKSCIAGRD